MHNIADNLFFSVSNFGWMFYMSQVMQKGPLAKL